MESPNYEEILEVQEQESEKESPTRPPSRLSSFLDPLGLFDGVRRDVERVRTVLGIPPLTTTEQAGGEAGVPETRVAEEAAQEPPAPGGQTPGPFQDLALRIRADVGSISRALFPPIGTSPAQRVEGGHVDNPGDDDPDEEDEEPDAEALPPPASPAARRQEALRLHAQGMTLQEIASHVGVTGVRVGQILREEGIELRPGGTPTERELEAQQRREEIVAAHHRGLIPRQIAHEVEVSLPLVYRALAEAGLRPNVAAEVLKTRAESEERLQQMLQLRRAGVSGAEIARRLGISEPRVVQILREFRAPPPPKRSGEFEQRAFDILPQVQSLRQDHSQENIRLTELMLNNLAEDAGQYIASLPEFPKPEMEEERWRVAFVRQQAGRALEEMETFLECQVALRQAQVTALPRLVEQARRCIDRAVSLLRQCCPPPPRPSPLREPQGV